ncbi:MAG: hypothetical protein ACKPEZ_18385, partial [Planktothrix sp.]
MFQDCAGVIKLKTKDNRELRNRFRDFEDQVEDNKFIDDETMRKILRYSLEWSGGRELWDRFRVRVQESFSELVILPILLEVFTNYDALAESLGILIEAGTINNKKQVDKEIDKIANIRQDLQKNIKKIGKDFQGEIEELIAGLKSEDPNTRIKIKQSAEKKGFDGFSLIFDAVNE